MIKLTHCFFEIQNTNDLMVSGYKNRSRKIGCFGIVFMINKIFILDVLVFIYLTQTSKFHFCKKHQRFERNKET